ncbi:hypothetical protein A6F49_02425 [Enteractinococcus helveticum]|uniref:Uncharacterized protein n=1 Tax=Enteractinococcus helveticum TaxID=1837282 RepID=A0A1B7LUM3_9MICC|nr:hypothetical protein A6F49_02425 [Enteractinococcus helveticum]
MEFLVIHRAVYESTNSQDLAPCGYPCEGWAARIDLSSIVGIEQAAPVLDRIVVSEIDELWSPHTAPIISVGQGSQHRLVITNAPT